MWQDPHNMAAILYTILRLQPVRFPLDEHFWQEPATSSSTSMGRRKLQSHKKEAKI